jgi:hypothetical protein
VDDTSRAAEVYAAVADLYSREPSIIRTDCLYVAQQLVGEGYFPEYTCLKLVDVGGALDLIRAVEC